MRGTCSTLVATGDRTGLGEGCSFVVTARSTLVVTGDRTGLGDTDVAGCSFVVTARSTLVVTGGSFAAIDGPFLRVGFSLHDSR
jgi:hypothetical protein